MTKNMITFLASLLIRSTQRGNQSSSVWHGVVSLGLPWARLYHSITQSLHGAMGLQLDLRARVVFRLYAYLCTMGLHAMVM